MARKPTPKKLGYGEGSLRFDAKRGQYELQHVIDGKRYVERGDSPDAVKAKRDARRAELATTAALAQGTVGDLAQIWLDAATGAPSTLHSAAWAVAKIDAALGELPSAGLTTAHVHGFLTELAATVGRSSLSRARCTLSAICDLGVVRQQMTANPVSAIPPRAMPKAKLAPKATRHFDIDEYETVVDYLTSTHTTRHALMLTMLLAGLRTQEARALRWSAVDFAGGRLSIERVAEGKTGVVVERAKTRSGLRMIPMVPQLAAALRREAAEQMARGRSDYVFVEAGGLLSHDQVAGAAESVAKAVGVDYVNPHGYRHTFASVALARNIDLQLLAKLMGHKTVQEIINTYGHCIRKRQQVDMTLYAGTTTATSLAVDA